MVGNSSRGFPSVRSRSAAQIDRLALVARSRFAPHLQAWDPFDGLKLYERIHLYPASFKGRLLRVESRVRMLPDNVEAFTKYDPENDEFELSLSEKTYVGLLLDESRARFTFAHELGHLCLHLHELVTLRAIPHMDRVMARSTRHPLCDDVEWQANVFASRLLVPDAGLLQVAGEVGSVSVPLVSSRFRVSARVAQFRVEQFRARSVA